MHSHRSLLLKVLDGRHDNEPDLTLYDVQAGDRILICSDGLSGFVDHDRIERVLAIGYGRVRRQRARSSSHSRRMSTDNITVVVADVVDEPRSEAAEPIVVGAAADDPRGAVQPAPQLGPARRRRSQRALVDPDDRPRGAPLRPARAATLPLAGPRASSRSSCWR